ncbi:MAG: hypothetical protein RLN85_14460 [Pseudomonadales bacterium]
MGNSILVALDVFVFYGVMVFAVGIFFVLAIGAPLYAVLAQYRKINFVLAAVIGLAIGVVPGQLDMLPGYENHFLLFGFFVGLSTHILFKQWKARRNRRAA